MAAEYENILEFDFIKFIKFFSGNSVFSVFIKSTFRHFGINPDPFTGFINRCYAVSIDFFFDIFIKWVAHEIVFSNFLNKNGVIIPSDSLMRDNLDVFIEETYKRFFVRDITEAEREFFISFFESHPYVSAEMVYMAFALSNEYQYY